MPLKNPDNLSKGDDLIALIHPSLNELSTRTRLKYVSKETICTSGTRMAS